MKFRVFALVVTCCIFTFTACWSSKKKKKPEDETIETTNTSRFIVSFFSPGDGINRTAKKKFTEYLANNNTAITYSEIKWGREGEVDYCFNLDELNEAEQIEFIKDVKDHLGQAKKVNFLENKPCRSSR